MNRKHTPPLLTLNFYQNVSNKSWHDERNVRWSIKISFLREKEEEEGRKERKNKETSGNEKEKRNSRF